MQLGNGVGVEGPTRGVAQGVVRGGPAPLLDGLLPPPRGVERALREPAQVEEPRRDLDGAAEDRDGLPA